MLEPAEGELHPGVSKDLGLGWKWNVERGFAFRWPNSLTGALSGAVRNALPYRLPLPEKKTNPVPERKLINLEITESSRVFSTFPKLSGQIVCYFYLKPSFLEASVELALNVLPSLRLSFRVSFVLVLPDSQKCGWVGAPPRALPSFLLKALFSPCLGFLRHSIYCCGFKYKLIGLSLQPRRYEYPLSSDYGYPISGHFYLLLYKYLNLKKT